MFCDDAELTGLRLQCEVVCLGFVFDLLSVLFPLASFCRFLQSRMECNSMEGCGGDLSCRDTSKLMRFFNLLEVPGSVCVSLFVEEEGLLPRHVRGKCCTS